MGLPDLAVLTWWGVDLSGSAAPSWLPRAPSTEAEEPDLAKRSSPERSPLSRARLRGQRSLPLLEAAESGRRMHSPHLYKKASGGNLPRLAWNLEPRKRRSCCEV